MIVKVKSIVLEPVSYEIIIMLDEGIIFKKVIGKGWRNSVMQRRIYGRLTKSAKKEAEDWARQTKRTLVMELIKQRKHTWISRPRRQVTSQGIVIR